MLDGLFNGLMPWHWWLAGVLLIIAEIFAPGVFMLWLGLAAGIVGIIAWLAPSLSWEFQALAFAALSVITVLLGRKWLDYRPISSDQPKLNRRGQQYVGRMFTLSEPIVNGQGKIAVDDTTWKIQGEDCAAGSQVRVIGVDGVVLLVQTP